MPRLGLVALGLALVACGSARRPVDDDAHDAGAGARDAGAVAWDAGPDAGPTSTEACRAEADATGARWVTLFSVGHVTEGERVRELVAFGPGGRRVLAHRVEEGLGVWRPPTYAWRRRGDAVVVQVKTPLTATDRCPAEGCVTGAVVFGPEDVRAWSTPWPPDDPPGDEIVWALRDGRFVVRSAEGSRLVRLDAHGAATEQPLDGDVLWLSDRASADGWYGAIVATDEADDPPLAVAAFVRPGGPTRRLTGPGAPRWSAERGDFAGGSYRFSDDGRWLFTRFVAPAGWELVAAGPDDEETVALPLDLFERSEGGVVPHGDLVLLGQSEASRGGYSFGAPTALVDRRSGEVTPVPLLGGVDVRTVWRDGVAATSIEGLPRLRVDVARRTIETYAPDWSLPRRAFALGPLRPADLSHDGRVGLGVGMDETSRLDGLSPGLYVEPARGESPVRVGRPVWATDLGAFEVGGTWWVRQAERPARAGTPPPGTVRGDATQLIRDGRTWVFPFFHGADRFQRTVYPTRAGRCAVLYDREADPPRFELVDLVTGETADLTGAIGAPFFLEGLDAPW